MPEILKPLARRLTLPLWGPALLLCLACAGSVATAPAPASAQERASGSLTPFRSDRELRAYLRKLGGPPPPVLMEMAPPPAAPPAESPAPGEVQIDEAMNDTGEISVTGSVVSSSITNVQEAGVDEGGIVKVSGDRLVILRRGRIFTVSLADGGMRPVDSINAYPPGVDASGDWYDEMLVHGDRIIVVGYSYDRGGSEISRFRMDAAGKLRFEDAWHLKSNDYYSSRNYASRLIGDRLIFYAPLDLSWDEDPLEALPGVRRWTGNEEAAFKRIARGNQIYIPPVLRNSKDAEVDTLHTVTTCDLSAPALDCSAIGVLGPEARTFYVSRSAVYLWIDEAWDDDPPKNAPPGFVFRLPLDEEEAPSAVGARGAPIDQFSLREDPGVLNVLVRSEGGGDAMWRPEVTEGDVALVRIPISAFGTGSRELARSRYRTLPRLPGESWSFQNRFAGNHVLYGAGEFDDDTPSTLIAAPLDGGPVTQLPLRHSVDRLDLLGRDAVVIGTGKEGLHFTAVELARGAAPRLGSSYVHRSASEGETRSHAFFFRPDAGTDGASGILGLPVSRPASPALERFFGSSAAMLFLRRLDRRFAPAGELEARTEGVADDGCVASCVDWYGNARPIFLGRRTFALLGYELVEGTLDGGRIREVGRTSFAPAPAARGQ